MAKLLTVPFRVLPNDVHCRFCQQAKQTFATASTLVQQQLGEFIGTFNEWYEKEYQLVNHPGVHTGNIPEKPLPVVRRITESYYRKVADAVNAAANVEKPLPDFAKIVAQLNPVIEALCEAYHPAKLAIGNAQVDGVADQYYDGTPQCPTPAVFYKMPDDNVVKLVQGKDYKISYKNNLKPGEAQCILHGVGKFNCTKEITFVISRSPNTQTNDNPADHPVALP